MTTPENRRRELDDTQAKTGRAFWRDVLTTGGFTAIPRWTHAPRAGVGELEVPVPADLTVAIRQLAEALVIPTSTVLLTAHLKVLAALSGEAAGGDRLRPAFRSEPGSVSTEHR